MYEPHRVSMLQHGARGNNRNQYRGARFALEPSEQTVEGDETGLACEDAVETSLQSGLALLGRMKAVGLEIAVEPPDQITGAALGVALLVGKGVELVNQALGMDPAQAVLTDVELTGVVADDDGIWQKAMRLDAAPQGALGGNHDRIGRDLESRDAKSVEMCGPGAPIGEDFVLMFGQSGDTGPASAR